VGPTRLALCGNVFPADEPSAVLAAIRGPAAQWSLALQQAGHVPPFGFGLYLSAHAARTFCQDDDARRELQAALVESGLQCWTANAFPYGGFHATIVKQRAFEPDWRSPERLRFTLDVAKVLLDIAPADGSPLSISTCPLGYGSAALQDPASHQHLQLVAAAFAALAEASGRALVLAIEPEPDGALERVSDLANWLQQSFTPTQREFLGICWDLCHSAVVGETTAVVLRSLASTGVKLAKIQISSALELLAPMTPTGRQRFQQLTEDAYLHQVRGVAATGAPFAFADMTDFLASADSHSCHQVRVHCHVPVCRRDYGEGLSGTPWQAAVVAAWQAGYRDFELETYTLLGLPDEVLERGSVVDTMKSEMLACFSALQLDTPAV
jgi:hypothetical protein